MDTERVDYQMQGRPTLSAVGTGHTTQRPLTSLLVEKGVDMWDSGIKTPQKGME